MTRNLENRRRLSPESIAHLTKQVQLHFPEARIQGYENLIDLMTNDPKDRHVAAAAVRAGAQLIVTSNLKDFPQASFAPLEIEARHPDQFLMSLYAVDPKVVVSHLRDRRRR